MLRRHPPLRDLSEYASTHADGVSTSSIEDHVQSCHRCAQSVEMFKHLDVLVQNALSAPDGEMDALDCPPPPVLADYLENLLSDKQRTVTEKHLSRCRLCRDSLIQILEIAADECEETLPELDDGARRRTLNVIKTRLREQRTKCGICNEENEPGSLTCSGCGAQLRLPSPMFLCISCRQEIPATSRYCPNCGSVIAPPKKMLGFIRTRSAAFTDLIRTHIWAVCGLASIGTSFFVRRYFVQFIALGLIFGAKWVLDQAQLRIYTDILRRLRREEKTEEQARRRIGGEG